MKYTHNYMKIFLDTADTEIINEYFKTGLVDGVTTNPTLIMKSGRNPEDVYQEIKDIGVNDISMEVVGDEGEKETTATRLAKRICCMEQLLSRQVVLLKIDTGKAVDLQVHERWPDPLVLCRRFGGVGEFCKDSVIPLGQNRLSVEDIPGVNFAVGHGGRLF